MRRFASATDCSVCAVQPGIAVVEGVGSLGHPDGAGWDDGVPQWPELDVDIAETHTLEIDEPAEEAETLESLNLL